MVANGGDNGGSDYVHEMGKRWVYPIKDCSATRNEAEKQLIRIK